ncbi:MAG: class I SAM-dependent rRNA methyltransferase [Candidatus Sericytochromatia bacterium]
MLSSLLESALLRRRSLFSELHAENTFCYRLFHGTNEGVPGLTVDRYGSQLLVQSFHTPASLAEREHIIAVCQTHFQPHQVRYFDRSAAHSRRPEREESGLAPGETAQELGLHYHLNWPHPGQDPLLFLDLRVGRRYVKAHSQGKTVLNLFAYTCGLGLAASAGGAAEVWNVDFAESSLAVGAANLASNGFHSSGTRFLHSDFFAAARQLAGLGVASRRQQRLPTYPRLAPQQFDLVCLDPPRWAKSPFGTVDLLRDYASVFKPALLATRPGGTLLCTHNVAAMERDVWLDGLERTARKAGRPLHQVTLLSPEADFPSPDGQHPLKIAVLSV